jgi:ethanolamine utilization protein EutM
MFLTVSSNALGLIETKGLVGAIEACDAAAKAAAVVVATAELTDAAYMTLKIEGELGAVQAAVDAGARAAERVGELVAAHVIPRPDKGLDAIMPPRRYVSKYHPDDDRPRLSPGERPVAPSKPAPGGAGAAAGRREKGARKPRPAPPPADEVAVETGPPPEPPETGRPPRAKKQVSLAEMEKMPVVKLRQFARAIENLPIQGRQISMANKQQLIDAIKSVLNLE